MIARRRGTTGERLRVILEIGKATRRIVAGAMDWPGLDRWGRSEDEALAHLSAYRPRYAAVAERAGLGTAFARTGEPEVVERVAGNSSTDFWGIAHVPSRVEGEALSTDELERRLALLRAGWAYFDDVAGRVSAQLRLGPRGGGRSRDEIIRHVAGSERHLWWPKVGIRVAPEALLVPGAVAAYRDAYLDAIRAFHADGRLALRWPIRFLIRRTAHHTMDHAWELEDRDPGA